ncbi:hypothetical protein IMAU80188_01171 [Lactiplantibacillus plantarum]|nr:hypothetical protein [Lactiplantibacillus plantarum]MCG0617593.1 hypothetical protein [Lactiplantibacillus plantarum]MCG0805945.1 hypothetical protein [Lactiplantibacillus plantarum]MCG0830905.1 hypothetical protein [Lactiplantibacillus plantarum]MCG0849661.1 hypothetical protein [Lactiplantibacillus plantarum]
MLFLAIMGLIVFLLALFSVIYARQTGGGWKFLRTCLESFQEYSQEG